MCFTLIRDEKLKMKRENLLIISFTSLSLFKNKDLLNAIHAYKGIETFIKELLFFEQGTPDAPLQSLKC